MIFQYTLEQVLSGEKTATSRMVKAEDSAVTGDNQQIEAVIGNGREKYRVGKTYAVVPARGKPQVARIRLLGIKRHKVSEMTQEEAKMEGCASREEFFELWNSVYGGGKLDADVWQLRFELAEDEG